MNWKCTIAVGLVISLNSVARSAYLSELFIAGPPHNQPNAIEIAELGDRATFELLVLDARPGNFSEQPDTRIRQVIRFDSQGHNALLLHEGVWNSSLYQTQANSSTTMSLSDNAVTGATQFDFSAARTLVLLDRQTLLGAGVPYNNVNPFFLNGAQELDVMTFALSGEARSLRDESVLELEPGEVVSIATDPLTLEPGVALTATPDGLGHFTAYDGYFVTPGRENMLWSEIILPEPSTALFIISGLTFLFSRRPQSSGK